MITATIKISGRGREIASVTSTGIVTLTANVPEDLKSLFADWKKNGVHSLGNDTLQSDKLLVDKDVYTSLGNAVKAGLIEFPLMMTGYEVSFKGIA